MIRQIARILRVITLCGLGILSTYSFLYAKNLKSVAANQVKAAFIYNLIQFIEWPATTFANAVSPIEIGIFGKDPFGSLIDEVVEGVRVQGVALKIRRSSKLEDLQSCQVIFISRSEAKFLPRILGDLEKRPILTISDMDQFAWKGGIVGFVIRQNKVRFQINLNAARKSGLKISSKVLRLAEIIEGTAQDNQ